MFDDFQNRFPTAEPQVEAKEETAVEEAKPQRAKPRKKTDAERLAEIEAQLKKQEAEAVRRENERKKTLAKMEELKKKLAKAKQETLLKILSENGIEEPNQLQELLKYVDETKPELLPAYASTESDTATTDTTSQPVY